MKNKTRRFLTNAFALALAANGTVAFAQNAGGQNAPQDKPQEKKVERQVWVDSTGQNFDVRIPSGGATGVAGMPRVMSFTGSGNAQDVFSYSFVASEVGANSKIVKGAPYSAEIVDEFVQTLANGNRIVRRNTSSVARDSQGRMRREQNAFPVGVVDSNTASPAKTIIITDPVESTSYILNDKAKVAHRARFAGGMGGNFSFVSSTTERSGEKGNVMVMTSADTIVTGQANVEPLKKINVAGGVLQGSAVSRVQPTYPAEAKAARVSGVVRVGVTINEAGEVTSAEAISGHPMLRDAAVTAARQWKFKATELSGQSVKVNGTLSFNFSLAEDGQTAGTPAVATTGESLTATVFNRVAAHRANAQTTSLGKQMIEGVECEGTKIVETIPAGQIGNDQPIEIVTERWTSPELQLTVLSKHSDPRTGETTVRMTNLLRGEPDAYLFKVPTDYTVKEVGGAQTFMRTTKPE